MPEEDIQSLLVYSRNF